MIPTNKSHILKKSLLQTSALGNNLFRGRLVNYKNSSHSDRKDSSLGYLGSPIGTQSSTLQDAYDSDSRSEGSSSSFSLAVRSRPRKNYTSQMVKFPTINTLCKSPRSIVGSYDTASASESLQYSSLLHCSSGGISSPLARSLYTSPRLPDSYVVETEEEFEEKVMHSPLPVVVSFHADWCEPCHELRPLLQEMVARFPGQLHLAEVRVDDHLSLVQAFEVEAVPAVLGVVGGQVTNKFVGFVSYEDVKAFVEEMVAG